MSSEPFDISGAEEPPAKRRRASERGKRTGDNARSGRRRPSLETRLREVLEAIAEWTGDRDEELAGVLRRDAEKMAGVLAKVADLNPVGKRIVSVLADVLEPIRAFGPTLRLVWSRFVARRAERYEQELEELGAEITPIVTVPVTGDAPAEPETPVAEPWRIP